MYTSTSFLTAALLFTSTILAGPVKRAVTPPQSLIQALLNAPTAVDRINLLPNDSDFVFNFNSSTPVNGSTVTGHGGRTVVANRKTFPAVIGNGGSVTVGFLGPCGFNTPHVHPRAAEFNLVVQGRLTASVTAENGARHMNHTLNKWEMTVFPAGALHTEFNPDCTDAVFVASFPNEDAGVLQMAQAFLGLEDEIIEAVVDGAISVDGKDLDKFRPLIPANVALGVESCLKKCGINHR